MKIRMIALAGVAVLALTGSALAGEATGWYVDLSGGYDHMGQFTIQNNLTLAEGKVQTDNAGLITGAWGYKFHDHVRVEGEIGWVNHNVTSGTAVRPRITSFMLNVGLRCPLSQMGLQLWRWCWHGIGRHRRASAGGQRRRTQPVTCSRASRASPIRSAATSTSRSTGAIATSRSTRPCCRPGFLVPHQGHQRAGLDGRRPLVSVVRAASAAASPAAAAAAAAASAAAASAGEDVHRLLRLQQVEPDGGSAGGGDRSGESRPRPMAS